MIHPMDNYTRRTVSISSPLRRPGGVLGSGCGNQTNSPNNFAGTGIKNTIATGSDFSSILNGQTNTINANSPFSAILGGNNNVIPAGCSNAGIFGQGITAVASDTFHVNCLNANSIPGPYAGITFLPTGTVYYGTGPAIIPGAKVLYIV